MATFIPYQPRANVLPSGKTTFSKSPTVIGSSTLASSMQSSKAQVETASIGKADFVDFVDFVDLTASHRDPPQEYLVLRELLGSMCDDPNDRSIRIARDHSDGAACNDKVKPGEGADKDDDDDDIDYESDTSDPPSLREIFRQNETQFGTRNNLNPKAVSSPAPVDRTSADGGREGDRNEIAGIENTSTFRPRMEIGAQDTEIIRAGSKGDPTLTSDYHPENISPFPQHPLPSPPMTPEAIKSDPIVAIQGTRTRKRSWSSTKSTTGLDAGLPVKRSGRSTKETWKAREAREAREAAEAKQARTSWVPYGKNKARSICLGFPLSDVGKVADIEDVYLAEDGSIQCLVSWKSSLIAMENLVDRELRQRCEELFGKRYGHQELQRRAAIKRQTKK